MNRVSSWGRSTSNLIILFFLQISLQHSYADDANAFVYAGCTQAKFTPGTPYQYNVNALFSSLANTAGFAPYVNFSSSSATPSPTVYGLYQCRGDISASECSSCVRSGLTQLSSVCALATGGAIQLQGCYIRYGKEQFIGQLDKSVAYQKCGAAADGSNYGDLVGMRDYVLGCLTSGGGGGGNGLYRAAAAAKIQAMAQCVGDLSLNQCADCIATAVNGLRSICGVSVSGEFYLTKCYAKYWSRGTDGSPHSHGEMSSSLTFRIFSLFFLPLLYLW